MSQNSVLHIELAGPVKVSVIALGVAGLVISWVFFADWMIANPIDVVAFLKAAFRNGAAAGLATDLTFCGFIVTVLSLYRRKELGWPRVVSILLGTWILGVCVGLALFFGLRNPVEGTPPSA